MKNLILIVVINLIFSTFGSSQDYKKDNRDVYLKEDPQNMFRTDQISDLDILQALELAGIGIYKFNLGKFDKKYELVLFIDEYVNGELIKSESIMSTSNEYPYIIDGGSDYFIDFMDQIKILTKQENNKLTIDVKSYKMNVRKLIHIEKKEKYYNYHFRRYSETTWKLDKNIPMLLYATSWKDERGIVRFCGTVKLSENDEETKMLLSNSPHYFIINYKISNII